MPTCKNQYVTSDSYCKELDRISSEDIVSLYSFFTLTRLQNFPNNWLGPINTVERVSKVSNTASFQSTIVDLSSSMLKQPMSLLHLRLFFSLCLPRDEALPIERNFCMRGWSSLLEYMDIALYLPICF